jgi:hypothetical protein
MSKSGPLRPVRADLSEVDATFEISPIPVFDLTFHYKAGARDSSRSVNVDYHEGLELLLERLIALRVTILGIVVDSDAANALPRVDRELDLDFPIELEERIDPHELRLDITRAQKPVARRDGVKPGGGNDQKRIIITICDDRGSLTYERLRETLVGGDMGSGTFGAPDWWPASSGRHARRRFPTVKDLMDADLLPVGSVLCASVRGRSWRIVLERGATVQLEAQGDAESLGQLTNRLAGHSESAMRMWSMEDGGRLIPLTALRDELESRWSAGSRGMT